MFNLYCKYPIDNNKKFWHTYFAADFYLYTRCKGKQRICQPVRPLLAQVYTLH